MRRLNRTPLSWIVAGVIVAGVGTARAEVIWDYSPETTGAAVSERRLDDPNALSNRADSQNFAETVSFSASTTLTGMDIYSHDINADVGEAVKIRVWSDSGGDPDTLLLNQDSTIGAVDTDGVGSWSSTNAVRAHATLSSPFQFDADTIYWVGMTGVAELGLLGIRGPNQPDNGHMALFSGTTFSHHNSNGDMPMRLHGNVVPLPASAWMGLSLLALLAIAAALRRARPDAQLT